MVTLSCEFGTEMAALTAGAAALDQAKAEVGARRPHNMRTMQIIPQAERLRKANRHARSAAARLLAAVTALHTAATRTRWCEEWLGGLRMLPARRDHGRAG
jgi:hypothetical protein